MAFDFATFLSTVPPVLDAKLPVLVRGRHGVGKSEVVYQIAKDRGLPVVERRASQMTEGDLLGMPSPELLEINGVGASQFRPFADPGLHRTRRPVLGRGRSCNDGGPPGHL